MKKLTAVLLAVAMMLSVTAFADDSALSSVEYYINFETIMGLIKTSAITDKTELQLLEGAIVNLAENDEELYYKVMDGVAKGIDENCAFYTQDEFNALFNDLVGATGGLGVVGMVIDGYFEVTSVFENGSGYGAGIEVGDRIIECDGRDLTGKNAETAVNYIRGAVGSTAHFKILKKDGKTVETDIVRAEITIEYHYSEILDGNIGYLQLTSFSDSIAAECLTELDKFKEQNVKNVILDLRYNTGGYMNGALNIASALLEKGETIISVVDKTGEPVAYTAEGGAYDFNFVILINQYTASAAEILTVALKENGKAAVVGTKSYGKATVQQVFPIKYGGFLRITVQQYLSPLGNFIHREGIAPHYEVYNELKTYSITELEQPSYLTKPRLNDSSEDVKKIEVLLDMLGYDVGEPDEYFGEDTERAVRLFQSRTGLYVYGVCDITTQTKIRDIILETKFETDTQLDYAINLFK